ncbi:Disease resistance protein (CC-NBS-LRR class) family [Rhynchospora pubera]|uniref:Disease resistance protein (CC-NBS-LRR class) family n=1 Tax=Rhynchospora pubera TaxID=906938 RepID=A0AAV8F6E5_9POAL|nr:Disease resistance protein (CC-NBS-LRR class) family [Rhynchospora pubera]
MVSLISFLSNTATSVITAVVPSCIEPISRNITYPFKVSDNVQALEVATNRLDSKQLDVKNRVHMEELQGLTQTNQVEQWFTQVEVVKEEVDEIKKRYDIERSRCLSLIGSRSFNCWSNYRISKDAAIKLMEVEELCDRGNKFEEVATRLPQALPVGLEAVSTEVVGLQEILRYIDNDQYNVIGIWGMGGVGKTHLLRLVHDHYKRSSAFDSVIFVTASKECSIEKLQEELCKKYSFGRGTDVESQATIISNYLSNRNFLILLDDVWEQIDLQRVGIPFPLGLVNQFRRKVIITTRSLVVCGQMDVQKSHKVVGLDDEKALCLFYKIVGNETINSHPLIKSLAIEAVKELDCLPLALKTIGRSMHGKKNSIEWYHAIDLIRKSRLHEIESCREENKIYYILKLSYDCLKTRELKDCFLACSLWPEDWNIPKTELIECWMGLGLLDASDAENPYNPGHILIENLLSACLLEQGEDSVKMHDVIRDMALWLAHDSGKTRDKWIVRQGVGVNQVLHQQNSWCHVERAALFTTLFIGFQHLVDEFIPCDANKLHFLMVRNDDRFGVVEPIVKNMGFFCTLAFLDLSDCRLESFPQDISKLVNLRHLNLSKNQISFVPEDLKHVSNLRNLFLADNRIASFPRGVISELKELLIIDLFKNKISVNNLTWLIKEIICLRKIRSVGVTILQHATQFWSIL